jgi:uncharacterized protein YuzE
MSMTIAGIEFENHEYDDRGDVLYVDVKGYKGTPARAYASPEGHGIEYDEDGRVIAMTLVNVSRLLDRDGELRITWPDGSVTSDDRASVLAVAA